MHAISLCSAPEWQLHCIDVRYPSHDFFCHGIRSRSLCFFCLHRWIVKPSLCARSDSECLTWCLRHLLSWHRCLAITLVSWLLLSFTVSVRRVLMDWMYETIVALWHKFQFISFSYHPRYVFFRRQSAFNSWTFSYMLSHATAGCCCCLRRAQASRHDILSVEHLSARAVDSVHSFS